MLIVSGIQQSYELNDFVEILEDSYILSLCYCWIWVMDEGLRMGNIFCELSSNLQNLTNIVINLRSRQLHSFLSMTVLQSM